MNKAYKAVFIFIASIVIILLLSIIKSNLQNNLQLQNDQETVFVLQDVFPDVEYYSFDEEQEIYQVYDYNKHGLGYAFFTEGHGYGGVIHILVGLEDKETIKGISIISHNEQLSMGYTTVELDFTTFIEQFKNLKINDCYLNENNDKIDAITKATISSEAVVDIVREAVLEKSKLI
ncbi:MAG: FMN-binding protein [Eubacteriales bacterium]